jgi:hypothetical protein
MSPPWNQANTGSEAPPLAHIPTKIAHTGYELSPMYSQPIKVQGTPQQTASYV